jgi:hypothetical protein
VGSKTLVASKSSVMRKRVNRGCPGSTPDTGTPSHRIMAETDVPRIELADHSNDGVVIVFEGGKSFRFPSEFLWAHRTLPK